MSPEVLHPVEPAARRFVLLLLDITAEAERQEVASAFLRPIAVDLLEDGATHNQVNQHCAAILARAEQIESMGRPVPERPLHPGLTDYLESGRATIDQLMG